jgi:quinol monooxygenase YgiN
MSDTNRRLTLFAFLTAKPDMGDELGRRLMALAEPARAEAGNINYDLQRSRDSPDVWGLYQNWTSPPPSKPIPRKVTGRPSSPRSAR